MISSDDEEELKRQITVSSVSGHSTLGSQDRGHEVSGVLGLKS